ncbi:MAG: hypothetical protein QM780_12675 [Hyphomicrobium sp.]|uniref:hypothetical protein n=1 Tax=Hyphomicrobium sp. TaxID=82 RepID=UPI0039E42C59
MRKVGMAVVGFLIVVGKVAVAAHAVHSLERVSVATYDYLTGHHRHNEGRQSAHL